MEMACSFIAFQLKVACARQEFSKTVHIWLKYYNEQHLLELRWWMTDEFWLNIAKQQEDKVTNQIKNNEPTTKKKARTKNRKIRNQTLKTKSWSKSSNHACYTNFSSVLFTKNRTMTLLSTWNVILYAVVLKLIYFLKQMMIFFILLSIPLREKRTFWILCCIPSHFSKSIKAAYRPW